MASTRDTAEEKRQAGLAAAQLVESDMLIGLGTGSTAAFLVKALGERLERGEIHRVKGVPTSRATETLALEAGIPLETFETAGTCPPIDLTLDGADEVDPQWNLIKGGGGSLLREKIVAQASTRLAIMIDQSKLVDHLGAAFPLPIEVIPFGAATHQAHIRSLGGEAVLRRLPDGAPFVTDNGNWTYDVDFSGNPIDDPAALHQHLRARAGIVETGLFLRMTSTLIVGEYGTARVAHASRE